MIWMVKKEGCDEHQWVWDPQLLCASSFGTHPLAMNRLSCQVDKARASSAKICLERSMGIALVDTNKFVTLQVPLFVEEGQVIRVETATSTYLGREK